MIMFTTAGLSFGGASVVPGVLPSDGAVPCAARPSTRFVHRDGPCRCFVGGPAPEFPPATGVPLAVAS